ncbi:uncharacterized protein LOC129731034 [Wyeomyia smithii]|uniref:uncharacterized protein LOC129731034 n=1 Tax=Wyeomyia smithii TaxID=174621 RepID=UPI002467B880|nr:uncharacterized protein LOC129731034 [Wyeomyia smithii]
MTAKPVTLIDLLELAFEKPESGIVNLQLLYKLFRELIVGLNIGNNQLISTESSGENQNPTFEKETALDDSISQQSGGLNSQESENTISQLTADSHKDIDQKVDSKNTFPREAASKSNQKDLESASVSESLSSLQSRQTSNGLSPDTDDYSSTNDNLPLDEGTTDQSSELFADADRTHSLIQIEASAKDRPLPTHNTTDQLAAINDLLKAYLVRLKVLENNVNIVKSRNLEIFEFSAKILGQVENLESRLCDEQKKLARVSADLECLSLLVSQYETQFQQFGAGLDRLEIQLREVKCSIRCIDKEREQFLQNVQSVTEQLNHFSTVKADRADVHAELSLRAYTTDLNKFVPFEFFNTIQTDVARSIASLHDEIFNQNKSTLSKFNEMQTLIAAKAQITETENIQRQLEKVLYNLQQMKDHQQSKLKMTGCSAGVVLKDSSKLPNCLSCGDHAILQEHYELVPQSKPLTPSVNRKAKEIFTIRKRSAGGSYTKINRNETVMQSASLHIPCKYMNADGSPIQQIAGKDGCWYLANND